MSFREKAGVEKTPMALLIPQVDVDDDDDEVKAGLCVRPSPTSIGAKASLPRALLVVLGWARAPSANYL